jgi:uncharacterized protein (DUF169 family)
MNSTLDWKDVSSQIDKYLHLRTFPVGIKLFENVSSLDEIKNLRSPKRRVLICQLMTLARTTRWTIGVTLDGLLSGSPCSAMVGLDERREIVKDGTYRSVVWFESKEEGRKCEESFPHLPNGKYKAMAIGPISSNKFEPDLVVLYGTPAQMILVINAIQWKDYERLSFHCVGESSCADYIAECYLSNKPSLTIPCFGERVYGHAQEEELVIAIPSGQMEKVLNGLAGLHKRGVRYPIPYSGPQFDVCSKLPPLYLDIYQIPNDPLFDFWKNIKKDQSI